MHAIFWEALFKYVLDHIGHLGLKLGLRLQRFCETFLNRVQQSPSGGCLLDLTYVESYELFIG
jgi:hypothetical protein